MVRSMEVYFGHNVRVIIWWDEVCRSGSILLDIVAGFGIGNGSRWSGANNVKVDKTVFAVINFD